MSAKGKSELIKVQRRITLRVECVYCTVFTDAFNVVTSIPPFDLQAEERRLKYEHRKDPGANIDLHVEDNQIRIWQARWDSLLKGRWTHRLIPDICKWLGRKHGSVDYWLTQALTDQGCFAGYLFKYKKLQSPVCWFCGYDIDDALYSGATPGKQSGSAPQRWSASI